MAVIHLKTVIDAPIERVFDLARSIDAHQESTKRTHERAVGGRMSGLIELGEEVTWRARHLGVWQHLTAQITEFDRPNYFQDIMVKGAFAAMKHDHYLQEEQGETVLVDRFEYSAPFGLLGKFVEVLFLTRYMRSFLVVRNATLKSLAESSEWQRFVVDTEK